MSDREPTITKEGRKRVWRSKVRTGCRTCKTRRVKCDETKPECNRCRKYGRKCDGYEADEPKKPVIAKEPPQTKLRPLLRKETFTQQPDTQIFRTDDEFRCFRLYCEQTAPQLSGVNKTTLWPRVLLQACEDQPFIRHAIFAIGALNKTLEVGGFGVSKFKKRSGSSNEIVSQKYHNFALWHYDRFLKGTRAHLLRGEKGRRMALIACILVVCIESLQNHTESAIHHSRTGVTLMHEWLANTPSPATSLSSQDSLNHLPGISSPAPNIIEDEILHQFNSLELHSLAIYDFRSPAEHRILKKAGGISIKVMPPVFRSVHVARLFLELVCRRTYHFISETFLAQLGTVTKQDRVVSFADRELYGGSLGIDEGHAMTPDQLQIEQEIYASEMRRWAKAFEPLFQSTRALPSYHPDSLQAKMLKLRSLAVTVRLAGNLSSSELIYDDYLPEFQQMYGLAKSLLENDNIFPEGSFCMDLGLTYDFSTLPQSCRDRKLRRAALDLLFSKSWREGSFGSKCCADSALFLMEVEEQGTETYHIPESKRARITRVDIDADTRVVTLHCVQGVGQNARLVSGVRDWSTFL